MVDIDSNERWDSFIFIDAESSEDKNDAGIVHSKESQTGFAELGQGLLLTNKFGMAEGVGRIAKP